MNAAPEIISLLTRIADALERLAPPSAPAPCASDPRLEQLVELEIQLERLEPGERGRVIQQRTGWSRATYYRLRAQLIEGVSRVSVADETGD